MDLRLEAPLRAAVRSRTIRVPKSTPFPEFTDVIIQPAGSRTIHYV
jgi:hypothetical protein